MAWDGWRNANVPKKKGKFEPLTAEDEAERQRMLELVPDGPPPRKRGKKAVPMNPDMFKAVMSYHGIEVKDGRA